MRKCACSVNVSSLDSVTPARSKFVGYTCRRKVNPINGAAYDFECEQEDCIERLAPVDENGLRVLPTIPGLDAVVGTPDEKEVDVNPT